MRRTGAVVTMIVGLELAGCSTPAYKGVGDPCIPSPETVPGFPGFRLDDVMVEPSAACGAGVCMVNHFQGRLTCPEGQPAPASCQPGDTCPDGGACVEAGEGHVCQSSAGCQSSVDAPGNQGKACCVPGTQTPVTGAVCGSCDASSHRTADQTIYCTCQCGLAEGAPAEDGATFCDCPSGFVCSELVAYSGLGIAPISGKYCIKEGTAFSLSSTCGHVQGYFDPAVCKGTGSP